jgi:hypothetical protein
VNQQQHYLGLDVSLETTAACVIDDEGTLVWRGKCTSNLGSIAAAVRTHAPAAIRVGLENRAAFQLADAQSAPPWCSHRLSRCPPGQGGAEPSDEQDRRQ